MVDPANKLRTFSENWMTRIMRVVEYVERNLMGGPLRQRRRSLGGSDGGCDPQNAKFDITVLGNPAPGTFVLIFPSLDAGLSGPLPNLEFNTDDNAAAATAVLITHPNIGTDDVEVTLGPWPNATMRIEFKGALANTDIELPGASWTFAAEGAGVVCACSQKGHS